MKADRSSGARRLAAAIFACSVLAGCSSTNLWPFDSSGAKELSRKPANAAEYRCDGNKVFYVRNLDGGAVWLIAPDREIRLEKAPGAKAGTYQVGRVQLELNGKEATLSDPPSEFTGCKQATPAS